MKKYLLPGIIILAFLSKSYSQSGADRIQSKTEKKYQAKAPPTQFFGNEAFKASDKTVLRWLGSAGFFINSRGTTFMVDPTLEGFDMPLLIEVPIKPNEVPHLDAVLVTHSDYDHYSVQTCRNLSSVTSAYHATHYVDSLMKNEGLKSHGHDIGEVFSFANIRVTLTPADHAYQNSSPKPGKRYFKKEDFCGFWIETPDGIIWAPGDSRLIPEHHLKMPAPDALFFDFSNDKWHFGFENAVKIANTYPDTPLLLYHWGTFDAPDFAPFNGNPKDLEKVVKNPGRIHILAPGEPFILRKINK
jgi:L-ascorbate metabolism protein UlaG (beta-lactamase superfamily)